MMAIKSCGNGSSGFPALESTKEGIMVLVDNTGSISNNNITVGYSFHMPHLSVFILMMLPASVTY
jgi:hypothetical protein